MFALIPAALLLLVSSVVAGSNNQCYYRRLNQIRFANDMVACSGTGSNGVELCCNKGDECGEDSICRSPNPTEGNEWYVGGCTDKTYKSGVCRLDCTSYKQSWITWNQKEDAWMCCGHYDCADGRGTTRMFDAVSPSKWSKISQSGGLSKTTKIIIGASVGGGVLIIAVAVFVAGFCVRKRRVPKQAAGWGGKRQYERIGGQQEHVQMTAPFVPAGENQPYSRPSSPQPGNPNTGYRDAPSTHGAGSSTSLHPGPFAPRASADDGA